MAASVRGHVSAGGVRPNCCESASIEAGPDYLGRIVAPCRDDADTSGDTGVSPDAHTGKITLNSAPGERFSTSTCARMERTS